MERFNFKHDVTERAENLNLCFNTRDNFKTLELHCVGTNILLN